MIKPGYYRVLNDDTQDVPPFGVMMITEIDSDGLAHVTRPTHSFGLDRIIINSFSQIHASGGIGQGHRLFPAIVAYSGDMDDGTGAAPDYGETWGPRADSWFIHNNYHGFTVLGDPSDGLVTVVPEERILPRFGYEPVRLVATSLAAYTRTGNIIEANANGAIANIDSTAVAVGDRVLYNQSAAHADNGIYEVMALGDANYKFVLRRAWDADSTEDFVKRYKVSVKDGTTYGGRVYSLSTIPAVLNTNTVHFTDGDTESRSHVVRGKLDAQLTYQGSATMSIWYYNGSAEADTGDNITVYDWLLSTGQTVASGAQVVAAWDARSSRYYLISAQCA